MLDEFKIVAEIYDKLSRQLDFLNDYLNGDIEKILTETYTLESKYEIPYLFYLSRQYKGNYNKERSYLINLMEEKLNTYFKNNTSEELSVKFFDIKRLLFSIYHDDKELCRFSLINKNYSYMYRVLHNKDELNRQIELSNNRITYINEEIIAYLLEIDKYKKYQDNYFNLFKEIKNLSGLFRVLFKSKQIKQSVASYINTRNGLIESLEKQKEEEYENQKYYRQFYDNTKEFAIKIDTVFNKLGYKVDDKNKFYV